MANEPSKTQTQAKPQMIPLSKIHELPGVFNPKPQDKSLGSMVLSIQNSGIKEAVILRRRDDGEYQLLSGYRRRRASELAKLTDIPALVYEMTIQEAIAYRKAVRDKPDTPIPGKLIEQTAEKDAKNKQGETPAAPGDKDKKNEAPAAPGDNAKKGDTPAAPGDNAKKGDTPAAPGDGTKKGETPDAPDDKAKDGATPSVAELEARAKAGERVSLTELAGAINAEKQGKGEQTAVPGAKKTDHPAAPDKGKEAAEPLTAAIEGPSGTSITQVFDKRLSPPDEAALKSLPTPKEGESFFITLHPAYLEKSVYNNFSVDTESENFKELLKSVELVGIKDPVLARFSTEGKLEILSGQRRHVAATMLNMAVPTIIQKIDDADAKIIVADGNLHRDKISSYDLSRALRMKMEGMKQKSGRRKKGFSAGELQSDAKLAQEMGMSVAKLNRIIHLSEAVKGVCDLVDDNKLTISVASEIAYLKPQTQESVLHLLDLGYKATNDRISRMKKVEGSGKKLDEMTMRNILDDKDIAPKQPEPPKQPEAPAAPAPGTGTGTPGADTNQPPIPASPDVPTAPAAQDQATGAIPNAAQGPTAQGPAEQGTQSQQTPPAAPGAPKEDDPFKGEQERPEVTKVILTGDRLRKYFPDVSMTPREIEESVYSALEERRQRQMREQQKAAIFKKGGSQSR